MGLYVFYCFYSPKNHNSMVYHLSSCFLSKLILWLYRMLVFFFDDPTTLKVQRLILPPAVLIHWWKRKGQVSHWDFRSLQHEISWKISLMKHFFHWMWRDFPIESFISLFPQRRCARGLPMLHFCRLLCVAQEPFEIDDLCGGGPRLTWGRPLAPIQLMGKSWIKVG